MSHTMFFTLSRTADEAGVSRQTLREWANAGIVEEPRHKVLGSKVELPLFSPDEAQRVREIAQERAKRFAGLRLVKDGARREANADG
jgi:hypothetical protein